ncbi:MAG: ribokinase [Moorea sp. SIO3I7]|uniref:ribokinase n=1 Tax=Moorena sp. SIO3I8 TaxID=2607833 RepID=UPI0013C030A9|nr:ribokinase [Moorena sp. SIO3I8]NEN99589.1 ribokinase [Moorena sp. SIO3I7]NEO08137.1 ribokinase [Moorena sp. SIO3I8]
MKPVIVFGSINMDLVAKTPRLPVPGETLQGHEFFTAPGGKGANQAVAVARLGIPTNMVGRVGCDDFGTQLRYSLGVTGVDIDSVLVEEAVSSGIAVISVDQAGENTIIFLAGANGHVNETDVERLSSLLPEAAVLLMQLEIPMSVVLLAAAAAQKVGCPVILDPAPAQDLPEELYGMVDIMTPNQLEASVLVDFPVDTIESAKNASEVLLQRGVDTVIVTLGEQGVFCATASESFFVPAFSVEAVDTVAAGDAFNGAMAVAIAKGLPLRQSVIWGAAAGALAVTKAGAQPSLPDQETFNAFLTELGISY